MHKTRTALRPSSSPTLLIPTGKTTPTTIRASVSFFFFFFFSVRGDRQNRAHACFMHCPKSNYAVILRFFFLLLRRPSNGLPGKFRQEEEILLLLLALLLLLQSLWSESAAIPHLPPTPAFLVVLAERKQKKIKKA